MTDVPLDEKEIIEDIHPPDCVPADEFTGVLDRFKRFAARYLAPPITITVTTQNAESYALRATHVRAHYSSDYRPAAASVVKVTDIVLYDSTRDSLRWNTVDEYHETPDPDPADPETRDVTASMKLESGIAETTPEK